MKNFRLKAVRKKQIVLLLMLFVYFVPAQIPSWSWASSGGGTTNDFAGGYINYGSSSIATDAAGNSYVTGLFNGAATFGTVTVNSGSVPNVFLAKYDVNGSCIWVQNFGGNDADVYGNHGCGVAVDVSGNVFVTGTFRGSGGSSINVGTV